MKKDNYSYHVIHSNLPEKGLNVSNRKTAHKENINSALKSRSTEHLKDNKVADFYVEDNSFYPHHHIRTEDGVLFIACKGNNFFFNTPDLYTFDVNITLKPHIEGHAGISFIYGYKHNMRIGYAIIVDFEGDKIIVRHYRISKKSYTLISETYEAFNGICDVTDIHVINNGKYLLLNIYGISLEIPTEGEYSAGRIGIAFTGNVGELALYESIISSKDLIEYKELYEEKTAVIPLRNGGNIPYTLTYSIVEWGGVKYLEYSLDGGVQYRERYPDYPRDTDQYSVEKDVFEMPYIALYRKNNCKTELKHLIYDGDFTVTDPGLHWQILRKGFNVIDLPIKGQIFIPESIDVENINISFGYKSLVAGGYRLQDETDIEFIYDIESAQLIYEGKAKGIEHIEVKTHSEKTFKLIPKNVYDRDTVINHIENNHFFCENEDIKFNTEVFSEKNPEYITVTAELLDVFGDIIKDIPTVKNGNKFIFTSNGLNVGVYRVRFTAFYGDEQFCQREIVFEVYDPEGKRCPPVESGLPVLFSMPNEQRYLDRDAFDLYNPVPDCNMEHYYAYSSMTADIGLRKRIWEMNKLFGRKWYVWDSDHRTLTKEEFEKYGDEILRQGDFVYYPTPYEWACVRHDIVNTATYNGNKLIKELKEFLKIHPEYNVAELDESATDISNNQLAKILKVCFKEWTEYAVNAIRKTITEQNKRLKNINPNFKRACYGPFPIYYGPMTTHHGLYYVGSDPNGKLSRTLFDGFAQLEDYPYSCAYNTYKGAGFLMHVLLHDPDLTVYPEEYTSSRGGCIDGAVKDAQPPIGKYDMPEYFNVSHSYEYAFNTSYLTPKGFRYWNTYGFMQRDFTESFAESLIKGWKNVLKHKPINPLKSISYLSEVSLEEDKVIIEGDDFRISNRSNAGLSYLYEASRTSGIPNGFTASYESVLSLTSEMTECIVLPSMSFAPENVKAHIRKLYVEGVALIAVGDVCGLEDIFSVEKSYVKQEIFSLTTVSGITERIFPDEAEFLYKPQNIKNVLLWAEGTNGESYPAIIKGDRACLINASIDQLGHRTYENHPLFTAVSISPIVRAVISQTLRDISEHIAISDGAGITLFKDEHGNTLLLAVDYSYYDLASPDRTWRSTVQFNGLNVTDVEPLYGVKPALLKKDEVVKALSFELHQQECILCKLIISTEKSL